MELSRHVLDGWRHISKRRIIFIQKFMVETFVDNFPRTRLDLTDINQHSSDRINRAGTTILMVTHDREMVDKMRKRVIALESGRLTRDERRGGYE